MLHGRGGERRVSYIHHPPHQKRKLQLPFPCPPIDQGVKRAMGTFALCVLFHRSRRIKRTKQETDSSQNTTGSKQHCELSCVW